MDNTLGTKSNRVAVNIAHVHGAMEPPEPGIAAVLIDGTPIHTPRYIQITAQISAPTIVTLSFEAEVAGEIAGKDVEQMLRESRER
jgi:hypothetical protein